MGRPDGVTKKEENKKNIKKTNKQLNKATENKKEIFSSG
jgi:hypothetical protein